jgi:hypothetical protein
VNKDKHVLPGDDMTTFGERIKTEAQNENRSSNRTIYGSDNEPLSRVFVESRDIDDDGKLF